MSTQESFICVIATSRVFRVQICKTQKFSLCETPKRQFMILPDSLFKKQSQLIRTDSLTLLSFRGWTSLQYLIQRKIEQIVFVIGVADLVRRVGTYLTTSQRMYLHCNI
ncbi:Hypothetical_protein [Hexamita inflata]|uniref:Hypothetical_protein n=1 Tax=Hexamita inflata TaxID=28002 RepID=A0ABP1GV82_9EUKA